MMSRMTQRQTIHASRFTLYPSRVTFSAGSTIHAVSFFFLLGFCAGPAEADYDRLEKKGDVEFRVVLSTDPAAPEGAKLPAVRLSGEFLTIEVTGPRGLQVTAPDGLIKSRGCSITRIKPDAISSAGDNRQKWVRSYRLDPERTGPATLQFAELRARYDGGVQSMAWPPLVVNVVTSIQRVSRDELFEDLPLPPFDLGDQHRPIIPAWVAAAALALGFAAVVGMRISRAIRHRQEDPQHWLLRRIGELRSENGDSPEKIARFYADLADLFRHYMERRFAVPAPNRTTREFLGDLESGELLDEKQRAILAQFLIRCDLVKFAREAPSGADCEAAIQLVLQFVEECNTKLAGTAK